MTRTPTSVQAAWALFVRDRFGPRDLAGVALFTEPADAALLAGVLAPRAQRGPVELVLGAAVELATGDPLGALASVQAAREAGVPLSVLDGALATIGLQGDGPTRAEGTLRPATWLLAAADQAGAVGRVHARAGRFIGSGVLVDAGALVPAAAGRPALLTCAHVCTDAPGELPAGWPTPLAAMEAEVHFPGFPPGGDGQTVAVEDVLWRAPVAELDACLLALAAWPVGVTPVAATAEEVYPLDSRVYLMGFPRGDALAISMEESVVQATDGGRMTYALDGQPGASGGPVFHWADLGLAGLHRGARGDDRQGVLLSALRRAVEAQKTE